MGIVCENAISTAVEVTLRREKKIVLRKKKLGVQKTNQGASILVPQLNAHETYETLSHAAIACFSHLL